MMHKLYKMNDIKIKPMSPFQTTRVKIYILTFHTKCAYPAAVDFVKEVNE